MPLAALAPVLLAQGLWVRRRALRLPEADGPRAGTAGQGAPLQLLILGDSAAAGVGCATQSQALSGHLVAALAARHRVDWRLEARTGWRTADLLAHLDTLEPAPFDVAVTSLGVNDVTGGLRRGDWLAQQEALIALLHSRFGVGRVVLTPVPPMGAFSALPQPLRGVLGRRAARFNAGLTARMAGREGVVIAAPEFDLTPDLLAEDGYHPAPKACAIWAAALARAIG
ncbi:MAG: SGNH/GDSL hydrolase family protein [Tepidimonas taiwanensis]|nr:SGNH/GDSL hydrolase family protein [Tepidimonas taiwanensis]